MLLRRWGGWSEYAVVPSEARVEIQSALASSGTQDPRLRSMPRFYLADATAKRAWGGALAHPAKMHPWEVVQDWPLCRRPELPVHDWDDDVAANRVRPHTRHGWWNPLPSVLLSPGDLPTHALERMKGLHPLAAGAALISAARAVPGHSWSSEDTFAERTSSKLKAAAARADSAYRGGWVQPHDWLLEDRRSSRQRDELARLGHIKEQDYASSHMALAYRATRIRKAVFRCVQAKRVMRGAED